MVLIAIAGMIKHNMWAVPIAIAFDLLLRSPRKALLFLTFSILALLACALWLQVISDGRVWSSLMGPRPYSFLNAARLARNFIAAAFPLIFIGALGVVGRLSQPGPRLVAVYGAVLVGGIFGGGLGVDQNVYFDVIIAAALGVGLLIDELIGGASTSFVGVPSPLLAALLIAASVIGPVLQDPTKFRPFYLRDDGLARAFADGTTYLRAQPGDAICHNVLLCFRAGKPFVFDIWMEIYSRVTQDQISNLMESGSVKTVQLSEFDADLLLGDGPNELNSALLKWKKDLVDQLRFYKEVRQGYKLHHRSTGLAFFVAR